MPDIDLNKKAEDLEKLVDDIFAITSGLFANIRSHLDRIYPPQGNERTRESSEEDQLRVSKEKTSIDTEVGSSD